jgi:predicted ABC-class ATPase
VLTPVSLRDRLTELKGRGYAAYQGICGDYDFGHFALSIDHFQRDRFASPTRLRIRVPQHVADFPARFLATPAAARATADWIAREASALLARRFEGRAAGSLWVDPAGRSVALRSAVAVRDGAIELRVNASFPPQGRAVWSESVHEALFADVPAIAREAMVFDGLKSDLLRAHVEAVEDQVAIRDALAAQGLVAFVADGAAIGAAFGDTPWKAPRGVAVTMRAPHGGKIPGLGIPRGVTLVTGAPFQGKSTFLRLLLEGTCDAVPGGGGGLAVTDASALAVPAEDGRAVAGVDVTGLLPGWSAGEDDECTLAHAPAGVAQAASIAEALEMGCRLLLVDEDCSVPWLLVSDERLAGRLGSAPQSVVPLAARLSALVAERGVSVIIATSVFSQFLDVADTVIVLESHTPASATTQTRRAASSAAAGAPWRAQARHVVVAPGDLALEGKTAKAVARREGVLGVGSQEVDLSSLGVAMEPSRLRGLGMALDYIARGGIADGTRTLAEVVAEVGRRIGADGLDVISPHAGRHPGDYTEFRAVELAAALNRLRCLKVVPAPEPTPAEETDARPAEAAAKPRRSRRRGRRRGGAAPASVEPEPQPEPAPPEAPPEPLVPAAQPAEPKPSRRGRRSPRAAKVAEPTVASVEPEPRPEPTRPQVPPELVAPAAQPAEPKPSRRGRRSPRAAKVVEPAVVSVEPEPRPEPPPPQVPPEPVIPAAQPAAPRPSRRGRRSPRAVKPVEPAAAPAPPPVPEPPKPAVAAPAEGPATVERSARRRRRRPRRGAGAKAAAGGSQAGPGGEPESR